MKYFSGLAAIGFAALTSTTLVAQTAAPTPPAGTSTAPAKPAETNLAAHGKWRATKLIGVDIYGPDNKKVGDVTEVVFDRSGKIETVTVGVGGFLGVGAKDVAIPFEQINWSDTPIAAAAPAPGSATGTTTATGSMPAGSATATAPRAPAMYPDHGTITMTKEQLGSAPAVTYSGS